MPDQGSGMAWTEGETKPEGSSQGKQLTRQKVHLFRERQGLGCSETSYNMSAHLYLTKKKSASFIIPNGINLILSGCTLLTVTTSVSGTILEKKQKTKNKECLNLLLQL